MNEPKLSDHEIEYFETYKIKESDLNTLSEGIDLCEDSGLFEEGVFDHIRFVTYDASHLYVFTTGEHASIDGIAVEEISSTSQTGYKLFKIKHSGFIGRNRDDYRGASAWLLCDELEKTGVNAKKFPNENVLMQPDLPQPIKILDVVRMAPEEPYHKI